MKRSFLSISILLTIGITQAQTIAWCDFQDIAIPPDTFLNGSDSTLAFQSAYLSFPVVYDHQYQYWKSGTAVSSVNDTVDGSFSNLYGAYASIDSNDIYGVANLGDGPVSFVSEFSENQGIHWMSIEVTNTTYVRNSLLNGDLFAKKFGGTTGDDPDYFFIRFKSGNDSLDFYLADYRFANNAQDYVISEWTTVDLSSFQDTSGSLSMELYSSDTGAFGINTPLFFAFDNIRSAQSTSIAGIEQLPGKLYSDGHGLKYRGEDHVAVTVYDLLGNLIDTTADWSNKSLNIESRGQLLICHLTNKNGKLWVQKLVH